MFRKPAIVYGEIVLPAFIYYFGKQSKIVAALLVRYILKCSRNREKTVFKITRGRLLLWVAGQGR